MLSAIEAYRKILEFIDNAPDEWSGDQIVDGIVELCEREIDGAASPSESEP